MKIVINFLNKLIEVLNNPSKMLKMGLGCIIILCILYTMISFLLFILNILF